MSEDKMYELYIQEMEAYEQWFTRAPLFQRVNAVLIDAGCIAADAIISALFTVTFTEDDDINF